MGQRDFNEEIHNKLAGDGTMDPDITTLAMVMKDSTKSAKTFRTKPKTTTDDPDEVAARLNLREACRREKVLYRQRDSNQAARNEWKDSLHEVWRLRKVMRQVSTQCQISCQIKAGGWEWSKKNKRRGTF